MVHSYQTLRCYLEGTKETTSYYVAVACAVATSATNLELVAEPKVPSLFGLRLRRLASARPKTAAVFI